MFVAEEASSKVRRSGETCSHHKGAQQVPVDVSGLLPRTAMLYQAVPRRTCRHMQRRFPDLRGSPRFAPHCCNRTCPGNENLMCGRHEPLQGRSGISHFRTFRRRILTRFYIFTRRASRCSVERVVRAFGVIASPLARMSV